MIVKWCAIEVLKFTKYSAKSDIWSFGVVLWELFSMGSNPYLGMNNIEAAEKVMEGKKNSEKILEKILKFVIEFKVIGYLSQKIVPNRCIK